MAVDLNRDERPRSDRDVLRNVQPVGVVVPSPLIQIRGRALHVTTDADAIEAARRELLERWFVRLPGLLDDATLMRVLDEIDRGTVEEKIHPGVGVEACFIRDVTLARLEFQLSDPCVTRLVGAVADEPGVGRFFGRVYRMIPGAGHYDGWHDDVSSDDGGIVALTLNLGREAYEGGTLEIRRKGETSAVVVPNHVPGDALLFRLDLALEHRISPMSGTGSKTALAGWFQRGHDHWSEAARAAHGPRD